jgi:coenzyme PQQ biosynthesis protein PqqD
MIRIEGTGKDILELCDGNRTLQQIVATLVERYGSADPEKIRGDVSDFLEALHRKRIVDYR